MIQAVENFIIIIIIIEDLLQMKCLCPHRIHVLKLRLQCDGTGRRGLGRG